MTTTAVAARTKHVGLAITALALGGFAIGTTEFVTMGLLPVGYLWSVSEKNRGGTAVLLVAVLVMPVLLLRLHDVWSLHV